MKYELPKDWRSVAGITEVAGIITEASGGMTQKELNLEVKKIIDSLPNDVNNEQMTKGFSQLAGLRKKAKELKLKWPLSYKNEKEEPSELEALIVKFKKEASSVKTYKDIEKIIENWEVFGRSAYPAGTKW